MVKGIEKTRKNNGWNYIVNKSDTICELSKYFPIVELESEQCEQS